MLRKRCEQAGSQEAFATSVGKEGVNRSYIANILTARKAIGPLILAALGLEKLPARYRRIGSGK